MDSGIDIKHELPVGLQDDLSREMGVNETVEASLPGSIGEALVVTDRRVIVLRERESGSGAQSDVYSYSFGKVLGADAVQSGTGGYIEVKLADPPADPDHARVYFPSYDIAAFQAVAAHIDSAVSSGARANRGDSGASAAGASGPVCSGCGAAAAQRDVFCARCGEQLQVICRLCGRASEPDAVHCAGCGSVMVEFSPDCPQCGGRVQSWMSYCPDCGSVLGVKCAACGMSVAPGWKHCAACGRLLGSESLDASAARSLQRRLQQQRDVANAARESAAPPAAAAAPGGVSQAQQHNVRGQELFDNEEIEAAIAEFERAVDLDPANPTYHCNLAVAYDEAERDEDALAEYEKTLEIDPDDLTALLSLGYLYNESGDSDKAQAVWSRILVISPNSAEAQEVRDNLRHQQEL